MAGADRCLEVARRLADARGRRVVFLSHCLLNENTRYAGGACRAGCVPEIVEPYVRAGVGIVQMPCPEERAWGGVLKRRLLALLGARLPPVLVRAARRAGIAVARHHARRLARAVAAQVADYQRSDMRVVAIVGVDGSPSCGVATTIDPRCVDALAQVPLRALTAARMNELVREHARPGRGVFIQALVDALARRGLRVPLLAHDLLAELEGP